MYANLVPRLPNFFGGFRVAAEIAGKPGDEAILMPGTRELTQNRGV